MNKLVKEPSYNLIPERDLGKTPILECRRIGIDFGGLSAVDEFTIAIGRTEICGIIGPNGAGKTTIFNLLTNVYRPTRGSILVNGVDTLGMTTDEVNRRGVARTFQNIRLFKDLTVEENVLIGLHNNELLRRIKHAAPAQILEAGERSARACAGAAAHIPYGEHGRAAGGQPAIRRAAAA